MEKIENKIHIVQIADYYPPHLGGLERVAQEVSEQLARDGYNTVVLTSDIGGKNLPQIEISQNLIVKRLWSFDFAHTAFIPSLFFELLYVCKPVIFHLHFAQAYIPELVWLISKMRKIPYIIHFHLDVGVSGWLGWLFLLYKHITWGTFLRGASKVIVFSDEQLDLVHKKYGVKKENIVIIPNGAGEDFFIREPRLIPHNPLRILSVGRLDIQKRLERLIEVVALLKIPAELTFVGDGELRSELEALVRERGLTNIKFVGKKLGDELRAYYRDADVFVTSSDREGMSLVVLEAMASGLPIIGSNVLGTRELVGGAGILVDEPYPKGFADAIIKLAEDKQQFQNLSARSIERAEQHTWKKLVIKLEEVYKSIIQ